MKKDIHPTYYNDAKVSCSCGNTFSVGSTLPEIKVEICSNCHPFYTGKQKYVDTAGRIDRFKAKLVAKDKMAKKPKAEVGRVQKIEIEKVSSQKKISDKKDN